MTDARFFFIGPDKSGSTWIHKTLSWHPQVFVAPSKELDFFNHYYSRGRDWYDRYFHDVGPEHRAVGEVEHDYLFSEQVADRIYTHFPEARLMVCLREPVERAFSAYLYMIRQGRVSGSFEEALIAMPELMDHGRYCHHLRPFVARFGRERVFIGLFDDLKLSPDDFARQMFDFLGVDVLSLPDAMKVPALAAAKPRSQSMAILAKKGALAARSLGLPRLVTSIKEMDLVQRVLFKEFKGDRPSPNPATVARLQADFAVEIAAMDAEFSMNLKQRWGYPDA